MQVAPVDFAMLAPVHQMSARFMPMRWNPSDS
jgi:hypothetical protein